MWSVKIHDFGKQWIESSWGKVDPHPGKRGFKGKSLNKAQNDKRARARATGEIRRKCLSIGVDHLVTLTYRDNVEDRERVLSDLVGCGNTLWARRNCTGLHIRDNRSTARRMLKKAAQQGRRERRGEAYTSVR